MRDELIDDEAISLTAEEIYAALDPARYLGSAEAFVDRALEAHETREELRAESHSFAEGALELSGREPDLAGELADRGAAAALPRTSDHVLE